MSTEEVEVTGKYTEDLKAELLKSTIGPERAIQDLVETYQNTITNGVKDQKGYKFVKDGITKLKKTKSSIEAKRKELTAPLLAAQRDLKTYADNLVLPLDPVIQQLEETKQALDDAAAAEEREALRLRLERLTTNGYTDNGGMYICGAIMLSATEIGNLPDEAFEFYVKQGKSEMERQKIEDERRQRERKELEELRAENLKLRQEINAKAAELEVQEEVLEKKHEKIEQPELVVTKKNVAPKESPKETSNLNDFSSDYLEGFNDCRDQFLIQFKNLEIKKPREDWWKLMESLQPIKSDSIF